MTTAEILKDHYAAQGTHLSGLYRALQEVKYVHPDADTLQAMEILLDALTTPAKATR